MFLILALNNFSDVQDLLDKVPLQDQQSKFNELCAKLKLHLESADTPEIKTNDSHVNITSIVWPRSGWEINNKLTGTKINELSK